MWYTVWRKINTNTYKFYMAAEDASVALQSAPKGAIITKTQFQHTYNFKTTEELSKLPQIH